MAEEERKKSFWETLLGIITAIGGLFGGLGGVAALIVCCGGKEDGLKNDATVQAAPAKPSSAADDAAQRAAAEAIAKAKAEAAAAKARAAELEKKLAAAASSEPQQGDIKVDDVTGMELVYVPGGCFQMGSPKSEKGRNDDEKLHEVCVDGFWMGKTEVTQGQWQKVMGSNPSAFKKGDDYPVERVSWDDTQDFIKKLKGKAGRKYRLPTEAEWEYACRVNSPGTYCGGNDLNAVAWYSENSSSTHPVGEKKRNAFGLYDMSGNVWEWCADRYGAYEPNKKENPVGTTSGSYRVIRGGGCSNAPEFVRAAIRLRYSPGFRFSSLGFRLLLPGQ